MDLKIKSAPTEVNAQKMQTPIVAKQSNMKGHSVLAHKEFAFLSNAAQEKNDLLFKKIK